MTNSTEFPRGFPRKLEGVVGKRAGNTERKPGRVREETLGKANPEPSLASAGRTRYVLVSVGSALRSARICPYRWAHGGKERWAPAREGRGTCAELALRDAARAWACTQGPRASKSKQLGSSQLSLPRELRSHPQASASERPGNRYAIPNRPSARGGRSEAGGMRKPTCAGRTSGGARAGSRMECVCVCVCVCVARARISMRPCACVTRELARRLARLRCVSSAAAALPRRWKRLVGSVQEPAEQLVGLGRRQHRRVHVVELARPAIVSETSRRASCPESGALGWPPRRSSRQSAASGRGRRSRPEPARPPRRASRSPSPPCDRRQRPPLAGKLEEPLRRRPERRPGGEVGPA